MRWYPNQGLHSQILYRHLTRLSDVFDDHAKVIGRGYGGIVIDHHDGTVSKAYFRHNRMRTCKDDIVYMKAEEQALRHFASRHMDGVEVPRLVDEPIYFEGHKRNPFFQGVMRISKLKGMPWEWHDLQNRKTMAEISRHIDDVGRVLAEFHRVSETAPRDNLLHVGTWDKGFTITSGYFNDEENAQLVLVDAAIRDGFQSRYVHGDFADRNLLVTDKGKVTGLLDFSFASYGYNLTQDFRPVFHCNQDLLPAVMQAFNRHSSGLQIDQTQMDLQILMDHAGTMKRMKQNPQLSEEKWQNSYKGLQKLLDSLSSRHII